MQHVLLLHGAIGAKDQLETLEKTLPENFIVHRINFSGHGGEAFSDKPFSISLFADEVLNYLSSQNIEQASIFGYSMGGYVAMYLAKYHPGKINKVITLATKFYWDEVTAAKECAMLNEEKIEEKIPAFAKALAERHAPNDWKTVLAKTKEMLVAMGKDNPLSPEDYETIQQPVLVMLGDRDKMVSLEETVAVYKKLPNGQLMVLPGTEHPIEKVDVGRLDLIKWLNG
jgi:pimeloyl-ACP methyl ester carboxylesterase